jgi:hypothetical protein
MKKSLRILTALSIAASSILFATPSQAVSVGGVDVTVSGTVTIDSSSANKVTLGRSSSSTNDRVTFDFGGNAFSLANLSELGYGIDYREIGFPSTPVSGYDKTINMNIGFGYVASASIYSGGSRILQTLQPSYPPSPRMRLFTPLVQFNYIATSGLMSIQVPVTTDSIRTQIAIDSNGDFAITGVYGGGTPGTITSWYEIGTFTVGSSSAVVLTGVTNRTALSVPGAPTSVTATSTGATTANVSFTAPASDGGATITSYTATSSPGGITGSISQAGSGTIPMTGLTAGTAYTFTVRATNSAGTGTASSASNSINTVGAPNAPTAVVATTTGKRSATVSFGAPASNNGSAVTSYTATSTPGGITKTLTQATGGTFTFDGLEPNTSYTFSITATNAIGTSAAATSNSTKTDALVPASISSLSFTDDGTGTGGKIVWAGKDIDAVLYTGPANSYPGPFNYGAFSSGWNGRIRNLTAGTEYTVSLYAISADGIGESKSLTFKTSAALPALVGAASATTANATPAQTDAAKLAQMINWINENTFVPGEAANMSNLLTKFMAIETSPHRSFVKVPTSRVSKVVATSLTPKSCRVENQGIVTALTAETCTVSYTVSGGSKAPATMVKDFVFSKFTK